MIKVRDANLVDNARVHGQPAAGSPDDPPGGGMRFRRIHALALLAFGANRLH
jgi:hypothetical protein